MFWNSALKEQQEPGDHKMQSLKKILFSLIALVAISTMIVAESRPKPSNSICPNTNTTTYTRDSIYWNNLNRLLLELPTSLNYTSVFYYDSEGNEPDVVYALYLCRGDISPQVCQQCVDLATREIVGSCPSQKAVVAWYDECLLRYSDRPLSPDKDQNDVVYMTDTQNITGNQARFNKLVTNILRKTAGEAVNSPTKFAVKDVNYTSYSAQRLYTLTQCTPDMSDSDCRQCLYDAIRKLKDCCYNKKGARMFTRSCNFRYEIYPFDNTTSPPSPSLSSTLKIKGRNSRKTMISASTSSIGVLLLVGCCIYTARLMKNIRKGVGDSSQEFGLGRSKSVDVKQSGSIEKEKAIESQDFPFLLLDVVQKATQHFSDEYKLGEGGFGPVYKGTLEDGREIAVKRLSRNSEQGVTEFMNEVTLISKLQHKNLVRLVGCCLEKNEKLLIYEYMPNKSLDLFLFDSSLAVQLDWQIRLNIICGLARGLMYLHEDSRLKIIHRDLKVSNVLLDHEMNPKISDFGMARIFGGKQNQANTNRVVGTYGYMAPEYAMEGLFSVKSDVFSFGVIVLEIISGRRNNGFYLSEKGKSLLTYAWKMWSEGRGMELIDPLLAKSIIAAEVLKCIHIGLLCVQDDPDDRPSMSNVIVMLAGNIITLPRPLQPAFSVGRVVPISSESSSNKFLSVNHVTFSSILPR